MSSGEGEVDGMQLERRRQVDGEVHAGMAVERLASGIAQVPQLTIVGTGLDD